MSTTSGTRLADLTNGPSPRRFFVIRNVGSTERFVRLGVAVIAAMAAARASGWPRAALGTLATAGLTTGLTRFCPVRAASGFATGLDADPFAP